MFLFAWACVFFAKADGWRRLVRFPGGGWGKEADLEGIFSFLKISLNSRGSEVMGQKRDRVNGALKKAFAEKNGKSLRWAQIEAAKDSPAWRAFLAEQFPPSPAKADGGGGEGAPMGGASDLARAGEAKESAWQILKRMEEQLETAARSGDVGLIASFTRAVREARANWERAGLHEQRLLEAAGSLVPVHVFHEMRTRGVAPLAELMAQQRDFIGSRLEAAGRPRFYEAWDEWAREWNRKIDDLNAEINGLLNHV